MKTPARPPSLDELVSKLPSDRFLAAMIETRDSSVGEYLSWERMRFKEPPAGLTRDEWWLGLKMTRRSTARVLPQLLSTEGVPFSYNLPDPLLRSLDQIGRSASGNITIDEEVTSPATRDRYVVSSLIEEAITSSQLEGASTSRRVAKDMLRSGRSPRDKSEQMIANNFAAMQMVTELRAAALTPELVLELHRVVTEGTLDDPDSAGRLQDVQDERVSVWGEHDQLLHTPPVVEELPDRLVRLCAFANGDEEPGTAYLPPVLRALAVHFMVGYDHYFEDGNGRTARALFYWCMLRDGYWLTEFLTISTILKQAPAQYARSFLLTEHDDGDLTHFFVFHTQVVTRAIDALHVYLGRKAAEVRELQSRMSALTRFNHRQIAVIDHAVKHPGAAYTARSHAASHAVTTQTARTDLADLEAQGLLRETRRGREKVWYGVEQLSERLA